MGKTPQLSSQADLLRMVNESSAMDSLPDRLEKRLASLRTERREEKRAAILGAGHARFRWAWSVAMVVCVLLLFAGATGMDRSLYDRVFPAAAAPLALSGGDVPATDAELGAMIVGLIAERAPEQRTEFRSEADSTRFHDDARVYRRLIIDLVRADIFMHQGPLGLHYGAAAAFSEANEQRQESILRRTRLETMPSYADAQAGIERYDRPIDPATLDAVELYLYRAQQDRDTPLMRQMIQSIRAEVARVRRHHGL
jgi:hypothetical protein